MICIALRNCFGSYCGCKELCLLREKERNILCREYFGVLHRFEGLGGFPKLGVMGIIMLELTGIMEKKMEATRWGLEIGVEGYPCGGP